MPLIPTPRDAFPGGRPAPLIPAPRQPAHDRASMTDRWESELRRSSVSSVARLIGHKLTGYARPDGTPGEQTPSTRYLCKALGIFHSRAGAALRELEAGGWISRPPLAHKQSEREPRPITLTLPADRQGPVQS